MLLLYGSLLLTCNCHSLLRLNLLENGDRWETEIAEDLRSGSLSIVEFLDRSFSLRFCTAAEFLAAAAAAASSPPYRMPENKSAIGLVWAPKVPPLFGVKNSSEKTHNQTKDPVLTPGTELVDGLYVPPRDPRKLNKLLKKNMKDTAGSSWFDMPALTVTPEIKKDLEILKVGTVIEPASEFFSGRLTKKERKTTLADELLHDDALKAYRKRKIQEIQESRHPGGVEKWKNKGRQTWKRAKQRRK
ncbi:4Fe-4S binding domain [Musa troglodytarum]|uniref:4Fe-4S binding domain n=1 Tax=Musa troglodytarum TaxID=320322 RepID=A0A9E7K5S7_9LILI|nr:4Fe-4S binding domain [Musa troglodytarum]